MSSTDLPRAPYVAAPLVRGFLRASRPRCFAWPAGVSSWRSRCLALCRGVLPAHVELDFPVGLAAGVGMLGIHFRFIAKDSLFATPLAPFLRRWAAYRWTAAAVRGVIARLAAEFTEHA